ncbi:DUF2283 domain-containing protein [Candidatus Woesearchaeota archaeon]|nr:DUF2283 domain-containing protein [Candidatus Woesearchaeota archaeon]
MKLEYDKEADAAYIYLKFPIKAKECERTIELNEDIIIDFDKTGKLIGIEILNASKVLNKRVIEGAISA